MVVLTGMINETDSKLLEELSAKLTYNMLLKDFSFQVMFQLEQ